MPRLPEGLRRSGTLAGDASWQGRVFAQGIRDQKAQELAWFASMMAAAKKYGPVKSNAKKYAPSPKPELPAWMK